MTGDDIAAQCATLMAMPLPALRAEWQRRYPDVTLPSGLPRDLLVRSILWQRQQQELSGTALDVARQLDRLAGQLARTGTLELEREVSLKPGTKLIREWRGRTIRVLVLDDGYLFENRRFASLSHVARAVTGTHWSGPRFFGLNQRARKATTAAGSDHV